MPNNPTNITNVTPPRVPLTDARTGLISREWYRFFLNMFQLVGNGQNQTSLLDVQYGPPQGTSNLSDTGNPSLSPDPNNSDLRSDYAELQKQVYGLEMGSQPQLGTMAQLQQANVPWLTFATSPQGVPTSVGTVAWDGGSTLGVQATANVIIRVGESEYVYAKASSAITKGQLCYHTGAVGGSGVITVAPTPLALTDPNQIVGVAAESIALNGFGLIQISGDLRGFNTTGSSVGETWADGDSLYYNPAYVGSFTKTKPSAPNQKTYIGEVINAGSGGSGSINVRIIPGSVLGGTDSNVQFSGLANNDLIQYDSALQYWKNVPASTLPVGTATNLAGGAAGSVPYQSAPGTTTFLPIGTALQVLKVNAGATAPQWVSGAALTKTDDTNVTLTLGGTPATSLLAATSLTLGWTGQLAVSRGGTGTGTAFTAGSVVFAGASGVYSQNNTKFFWDNTNEFLGIGTNTPGNVIDLGSSTAGRAISWGGTAANYANIWTAYSSGNLTLGAGVLATTTSDAYLSSYSGSIARAAVRVNSTDGSFEVWNASASTVVRGNLVSLTKQFSINTSGQVTMGTVTTGVWNGTAIAVGYGGTGVTSTPANGQLLIGNGTGYTVANLTAGSGVTITNSAGGISIAATGSGGTVTSVSVTSANGFAGTVANATTTPAITISTSITGLLYGNGTAIAAATVSAPLSYSAGTLSIPVATSSANGYLSSTDWSTFNAKQPVAAPVTQTANFSVGATDVWTINNKSGSSCTVTLPSASSNTGRVLYFQNYQAQTLVSASSNVVPIGGGAAGTSILLASAGDQATLVSNGTNWIMMQYVPNNILLLE